MLKKVMILASFFSFTAAMELQLMLYPGYEDRSEITLNKAEEDLTRSYEAQEMNWVRRMYDVSGLSHCMSRECFMVNALAKIKESIASARCCPESQDNAHNLPSCSLSEGNEGLLMGANLLGSAVTLILTCMAGASAHYKQWKFPEDHVAGSCSWARLIFNYTAGADWAHNCILQSMKTDKPCNITAAREAFNQNGKYFYDASACCYDLADPFCYQKGLDFNKEIYPLLHQQEMWDAWKPFLIATPSILVLQLAIIGRYKLQRYLRTRAQAQRAIARVAETEEIEPIELQEL